MKLLHVFSIITLSSAVIISAEDVSASDGDVSETHIRVRVSGPQDVYKLIDLGLQIEANIVQKGVAEGFIAKKNMENIRNAGFNVTEVEPPDIREESTGPRKPWYSYEDIFDLLTEWEQTYPQIAKFDTIGFSILNKTIYQFKISGSPDTAVRQRFFLNGCCHGNEKIGTETCMRIMNELLEKYESDQSIKEIVDRSDFVFHPIVNVDGFTADANGERRLSNGVDPNRAYGYKTGGNNSDGSLPYQWPEMKAYLHCMIEAPWYLNIDYHCGMIALLTPGGNMDGDAYSELKKLYPLGRGEKWEESYRLEDRGGGLAYTGAYGKCGSLAFLPELCNHYPPESQIEELTQFNLDCFMDIVDEMQKGVCGRVTDAVTGEPLYAQIQVKDKGSFIFSDPRSGAFHKYIPSPSGTFEVTVFANGFTPETKTVQANSNAFANLDFPLTADPELKYAALSVDVLGIGNSLSFSANRKCLGVPDDDGATIEDGFIIVDFGPKYFLTDQDGDDITVHLTNSDNYTVSVHYDVDKIIDGDGIEVGKGQGTASFDLNDAGIDSARWVRIDASGSNSPSIDAIEAAPMEIQTAVNSSLAEFWYHEKPKVIAYTPANGVIVQATIPTGKYSVTIFDIKGKKIRTISQGIAKSSATRLFQWDGRDISNSKCATGTYLFHIDVSNGEKALKVPVLH